MSTLTEKDKRYLEEVLGMSSGYVLDFTDAKFADLFRRHRIDIHSQKYQKFGTSKAKKLRAFWEAEPDEIVAKILFELLDVYETICKIDHRQVNSPLLGESRKIANRLMGMEVRTTSSNLGEKEFMKVEIDPTKVSQLPIEPSLIPIINSRLAEVRASLDSSAFLGAIILSGSILEAVLLGKASAEPEKFNRASCSPKKERKGEAFPRLDIGTTN